MTIPGMGGDRPGDGGKGLIFVSLVYALNFMSVVYFLVVDFRGGCSSSRSSSCDRGKTKSTPSPFDLDWNGLGLEFDKILQIALSMTISKLSVS